MKLKHLLTVLVLFSAPVAMSAQEGTHELKVGMELNWFTDFVSNATIHTGLFAEYTYSLLSWNPDENSTVCLKAGAKTGIQFETGMDYPRTLHFQAFPVYIPLQPLAAVTYQNGGFECSLKTAVGGELVIYEGVSPYVQWLITPGADFTWMFTENWGVSALVNWGFGGTIDLWNGPSMGICATSQF